MDIKDYENPDLLLKAIEDSGIATDEVKALYEEMKMADIEKVNDSIDKINAILTTLDTPSKRASLIWGLMAMVDDQDMFFAKVLMVLDPNALTAVHDDVCHAVTTENEE